MKQFRWPAIMQFSNKSKIIFWIYIYADSLFNWYRTVLHNCVTNSFTKLSRSTVRWEHSADTIAQGAISALMELYDKLV